VESPAHFVFIYDLARGVLTRWVLPPLVICAVGARLCSCIFTILAPRVAREFLSRPLFSLWQRRERWDPAETLTRWAHVAQGTGAANSNLMPMALSARAAAWCASSPEKTAYP
jgi:hypothetical protein